MRRSRFITFLFLLIMSLAILCSCGGKHSKDGIDGKDGTSLLTGNGKPAGVVGVVGDSYIDLETWDFYTKTTDGWVSKGNIKASSEADHNGTEGLIFYPINESECAVAVGTAKFLKEIVIPSKYKDYTVTTIYGDPNNGGFSNCANLEKITIPETVTTIGTKAFFNCKSLKSITLPNSVRSIGNSAFSGCSALVSIIIPSNVEAIEYSTFNSCTSLTSITLPDGLKAIGSSAFYGCNLLEDLTLPEGLESIGQTIIYGCHGLKKLVVPGSVTKISAYAFSQCVNLEAVIFKDGVSGVDYDILNGSNNLKVYCEATSLPESWSTGWNTWHLPVYWSGQWEFDAEGNPVPILNTNDEINGTYGLSHIVAELISNGTTETYHVGDHFFGMLLSSNTITTVLNNGAGTLSYAFETTVATNITYEIEEDKFIMVCEDAVDLYNNGNPQSRYELLIEEIDGEIYFVLKASNGYYNFSYYVTKQGNA